MGVDGSFAMYIDLLKGYFAVNSTSQTTYPLKDTIDEMFESVKSSKNIL